MTATVAVKCYIEEYETASGALGARLREKGTGRRVVLGTTLPVEKQKFIQFLFAARAHRDAMPDLFDPTGERDAVLVSGHVEVEGQSEVSFVYDDQLSYLLV